MPVELPEITSLRQLESIMRKAGVQTLLCKHLAPNDNSKNQPYLGSDWSALQVIPFGDISVDDDKAKGSKRDRFKAPVKFYWINPDGGQFVAPRTMLILYPKYPEVRLSGFLLGAKVAPSRYMTSRTEGRVLFLGVTGDRRVLGHVIGPDNPVVAELKAKDLQLEGVFEVLFRVDSSGGTRTQLLAKLSEIHNMGWTKSFRLNSLGEAIPYGAANGGGYTLEGLLGIIPNGINEPDYLGWEIKQHKVTSLSKPLTGGAITLMTPQPTGGFYKDEGVIRFVRQFGYPDTRGRADRLNFGGIHRHGSVCDKTCLQLELPGYNAATGKIENIDGGLCLVSPDGTQAALWHFRTLLEKWNCKHAQAAYIPSNNRGTGLDRAYRYGSLVALGSGTDFGRLLSAIASGAVYYDPGIKLENAGSNNPQPKHRSQFRTRPRDLSALYARFEIVDTGTGQILESY